jgi:DnaJ-domain-containing protein 1
MPKIQLKPRSAEFADDKNTPAERRCEMPGCPDAGEQKAPRDRSLAGHYWFCLEHVQEYNKAWDFFSGMSQQEIENQIVRSMLWDRPTRRYDGFAALEESLHRKAWQTYNYTDKEPPKEAPGKQPPPIDRNTPEFQAMAIMGLEPPLTMKVIKTRYKELAKKHHPDVNGGSQESEELLKSINMAYTILKLSFEKFAELPER